MHFEFTFYPTVRLKSKCVAVNYDNSENVHIIHLCIYYDCYYW